MLPKRNVYVCMNTKIILEFATKSLKFFAKHFGATYAIVSLHAFPLKLVYKNSMCNSTMEDVTAMDILVR